MITVFKNSPAGLEVVDHVVHGSWVQVVDPGPDDLRRLREEFGLPETFLTASLDVDELARTDSESDMTLIIVLVPYVDTDNPETLPYNTAPLGIILTNDTLFTISKTTTPFIAELTRRYGRQIVTAKRHRLILLMFLSIAQSYLGYLRSIETQVDAVQRGVTASLKNKALLELLRYQKSLIYFRTSLESNDLMMKRLQRGHMFELYPEDQDLLEDVLTENAQATNMTKISSDILGQMMNAYASIISNNLNDVMKILAVATIILSIPTVLASLYGMNVALPGQDSAWAFAVIVAFALTAVSVVAFICWKRDWL